MGWIFPTPPNFSVYLVYLVGFLFGWFFCFRGLGGFFCCCFWGVWGDFYWVFFVCLCVFLCSSGLIFLVFK